MSFPTDPSYISPSAKTSYARLKATGPDWSLHKASNQGVQIVAKTPPTRYNTLMHNNAPTTSGYFSLPQAYNDIFSPQQCGYTFLERTCDGSLNDMHQGHENTCPSATLQQCASPPSRQDVVQYAKFHRQCLPLETTPMPKIPLSEKCSIPPNDPCGFKGKKDLSWVPRSCEAACCHHTTTPAPSSSM